MPVTILNDPHATWAGTGAAFGQGVGEGLNQLANIKVAEVLNKKHKEEQFRESEELWDSIPGIDKRYAKAMARQPRDFQLDMLKNLGIVAGQDEQQQQFYDPQEGFRSQQQGQVQQQTPTEDAVKQTIDSFLQGKNNLNNLGYSDKINPQQGTGGLNQLIQQQQMQKQYPLPTGERSDVAPMTPEVLAQQMQQQQQRANQQGRRIVPVGPRADVERRHQEAMDLKLREMAQADEKDRYKFHKETIKEIANSSKAAKEDLDKLNRLEQLEQKGLPSTGLNEFLKESGFDISALKGATAEEFEKITESFLNNASKVFGGRVSNFELEQFKKQIPTLMNSPEGRRNIIAGMKRYKQMEVEYEGALKDIIKETNGKLPYDLQIQLAERVDKKRDQLSEQFKKDISKPVPEAQNKLVTVAQSAAGKAVGSLPRLAKGAAGAFTGAKLGAKLGPIGAGVGGLIGGLGGLSGLV